MHANAKVTLGSELELVNFTPEIIQRFWDKVIKEEKENGCWNWTGWFGQNGYGCFKINSAKAMSHRVSFRMNVGEIPKGMLILHKCDNPICIRPDHLFLGTNLDNIRDRHLKGRDAKGEGHGRSKLNFQTVLEAREKRKKLGLSYRKLAKYFGVSKPAITDAILGRTWKSLPQGS